MKIDLSILAFVGLVTLHGYRLGAVRQVSHAIGLVAAYLGAQPAAAYWGPTLAARLAWPVGATTSALHIALLPGLFLAACMASRLVLDVIEPGEEQGPLDQGLGALLGAAKGAAMAFLLLCWAVSWQKPLAELRMDLGSRGAGSHCLAFARAHNVFKGIAAVAEPAGRLAARARG